MIALISGSSCCDSPIQFSVSACIVSVFFSSLAFLGKMNKWPSADEELFSSVFEILYVRK